VAFHSNRAEGQLVVLLKDIVPAAAVDPIPDQPLIISHRQPPWVGRYRRSLMITDSVIIVGVVLASQSLRVSTNTRVELE
jgi:hypothetical protein